MQEILGSILPIFSKIDLKKLIWRLDFIGINHYTSFYVKDCIFSACGWGPGVIRTEGYILRTALKDGVPIGEPVCILCLSLSPFLILVSFDKSVKTQNCF